MTASPKRASSVCMLSTRGRAVFHEARLDDEIVELARTYSPACVAIDAPLSRPADTKSGYRLCDREVIRLGIRIFPVSFGPIGALLERGLGLAERLRVLGLEVIETFPSGVQRMLGVWGGGRRRASTLAKGLGRFGLRLSGDSTLDMIDAATCAYVALLYTRGRCMALGEPSEGLLYLPAKSTRLSALRRSSYRSTKSSRRSRPS